MLHFLSPLPRSVALRWLGAPVLLALALSLSAPAAAQTLTVQNGGAVEVSNGGTWALHGTTVDLGGTGSTASINETDGGRFADGTLTATRTLDAPSSATPAGLGITITTASNLGTVTITRGHAVQTAPNGNESIRRYYDLTPSQNNSGLDAELTLSYADAELNGLNESGLEVFKSTDDGASWAEEGADSRDATANTVTLGGIESLSRWTLGSESAPLPVELAGFEGTTTDGGVRLSWQTVSETNNTGFEIQRKAAEDAGTAWTEVGFVPSRAEGGTTNEPLRYQFTDADLPFAADRLEYRLRQVDVDGTTDVTDPVEIARTVNKLELRKTLPNPARGQATVRFAVPDAQDVSLGLYDVLGRRVRTVQQGQLEGRQELQVDVSNLSSGTYFLRLQAGGTTHTQRLSIVR